MRHLRRCSPRIPSSSAASAIEKSYRGDRSFSCLDKWLRIDGQTLDASSYTMKRVHARTPCALRRFFGARISTCSHTGHATHRGGLDGFRPFLSTTPRGLTDRRVRGFGVALGVGAPRRDPSLFRIIASAPRTPNDLKPSVAPRWEAKPCRALTSGSLAVVLMAKDVVICRRCRDG